jgi:transcriptional regulator of acetoin/glycerol metabolism
VGTSPNGLVQRPEIAQAWQRAAMSGLTPSAALDRLPQVEVDERSRLLVAAGPVLDQVAEQLEGTRYCVLLADRDATIVDRRVGQVSLEAVLDGVGAMRGAQFCEELTGTNSIATVHELRRGMQVVGDEHYLEGLRSFCCYGHPIVNPLTRRLEGVLDITGHAGDTSDLLAPFLRTAARAIEQRLLLGARVAQQDLLAAFQAATGRTHEPVLVVGEGVCLASPSAMTELGPDDHLVLRALAAGEGRGGAVVTLASGRSAQVGMTPVRGPQRVPAAGEAGARHRARPG